LKKIFTFAISKAEKQLTRKYYSNEKDISALKEKKSKQAWFHGEDVYSERPQGSGRTQGKRKKETYGF